MSPSINALAATTVNDFYLKYIRPDADQDTLMRVSKRATIFWGVAQIAVALGVDSLGYLSLDGMLESVPGGPEGFCHACFSGDYPTPPPADPQKLRFGCGC